MFPPSEDTKEEKKARVISANPESDEDLEKMYNQMAYYICKDEMENVAKVMHLISTEEMVKIYEIVAQIRDTKILNGREMIVSCSSLLKSKMVRLITGQLNTELLKLFLEELILWNYDETNIEMIKHISKTMSYYVIAQVLLGTFNALPGLTIGQELHDYESEDDEDIDESEIFDKNKRGIIYSLPFLCKKLDVRSPKDAIHIILMGIDPEKKDLIQSLEEARYIIDI